jgi:hypothetical protein
MSSLILTESEDGITTVTLNRPDALNALSRALRGAIVETFERLREDAAARSRRASTSRNSAANAMPTPTRSATGSCRA